MALVDTFEGMRIAVIGAAATGRAAAPVLHRRGARVRVYDSRPESELAETAAVLAPFAELRLGDPDCTGIEECDLVVPSPGVAAGSPVLQAARARGVPVLSEVEIAYRIARAPIVAVTGTNGKTTTVLMIAAILRADGRMVEVAGNTLAGGFQVPLIDAADRLPEDAWIVSEISSFQLEWVERFRPRAAVITNITVDHLNRHGSREAYIQAKARLLAAQEAEDWTVLNRENDATAALMAGARGRLLQFGRAAHDEEGTTLRDSGAGREIVGRLDGAVRRLSSARLRVPGEHNVENALAAAAVGMGLGCRPEAIEQALTAFEGAADRMESLGRRGGVEYVNNTMCTNVDAAVRSIEACAGDVVLIAGGVDKGSDFGPLGEALARRGLGLVAIGQDGPRIAEAARRSGFPAERIREAASMREAVCLARALAQPGSTVMLAPACASFDWYRSFEERGRDFRNAVAALAEREGE